MADIDSDFKHNQDTKFYTSKAGQTQGSIDGNKIGVTKKILPVDSLEKASQKQKNNDPQSLSEKLRPPLPGTKAQQDLFFGAVVDLRSDLSGALEKKGVSGSEQNTKTTASPSTFSDGSQRKLPNDDISLVSVMLNILDMIMTTQSQTQSTMTVASAKLATQESTLNTQAAMSQYDADMTNAQTELNTAGLEIGLGAFTAVTSILQAAAGASEVSAMTGELTAPESLADVGEIAGGEGEGLDEGVGEGEGEGEESEGAGGIKEEDPLSVGGGEEGEEEDELSDETEEGKRDTRKAREKAEKKVEDLSEGEGAKSRKSGPKTKGEYRRDATAARYRKENLRNLTDSVTNLVKGSVDTQNALLKRTQAAQQAKASLFRSLVTLVQASQQATADTAKKSGDIVSAIQSVIQQLFRSVVDASSFKG